MVGGAAALSYALLQVLILVQVQALGNATYFPCLGNCQCSLDDLALEIDCEYNNTSDIEENLNQLMKTHSNVTTIKVSNSNLEFVEKVRFETLTGLHEIWLENNTAISDLPPLGAVKSLHRIQIVNSSIDTLTEDVFCGVNLSIVNFNYNQIRSIHPKTFIGFPNLRGVTLRYNNLTSVDVWPLYLSVVILDYTIVDLGSNQISKFTNVLDWKYNYYKSKAHGEIILKHNEVQHFVDIVQHGYFEHGYESIDIAVLLLFKDNSFHVYLQNNWLVCDCVDFKYYPYFHQTGKSTAVGDIKCHSAPDPDWAGSRLTQHELIDFICDVHLDCPENCKCMQRPGNMTLHVECENQGLTTLPEHVPEYKNISRYQYILDVQQNRITTLESRPYFTQMYKVYLSHNHISKVDLSFFKSLEDSTAKVYLDNNNISKLHSDVMTLNLTGLDRLNLHSNPWTCSCDQEWLLTWMTTLNNEHQLDVPEGILCNEPPWLHGHNILKMQNGDFCSGDPERKRIMQIVTISVSIASAILIFFIVPFAVAYTKRVWIYKKFQWHPFDWDECDGEEKEFDAFFSYQQDDEDWVLQLIRDLESKNLKILFHLRDFEGGKPITINVAEAIDKSKRTVCVLSPAFVESNICKWEFDTALSVCLQTRRSRLLVLKYQDVAVSEMPRSMELYLKNYTYIDCASPHFMDNLVYSLPVRRLGGDSSAVSNTDQGEGTSGRVWDMDPLLTP